MGLRVLHYNILDSEAEGSIITSFSTANVIHMLGGGTVKWHLLT